MDGDWLREAEVYGAILLMGAVTLATRLAGAEVMRLFKSSPRVEAFLEARATAVIAAIVANAAAQGDMRTAAAIATAMIAMLATDSASLAMASGAGVAALWRLAEG